MISNNEWSDIIIVDRQVDDQLELEQTVVVYIQPFPLAQFFEPPLLVEVEAGAKYMWVKCKSKLDLCHQLYRLK